MTDDELRRKLAERLGWTYDEGLYCELYHFRAWTPPGVKSDHRTVNRICPPSLSELVATGEGRLTEQQQKRYSIKIVSALINAFDDKRPAVCLYLDDLYDCITAPAAIRARALLEALG